MPLKTLSARRRLTSSNAGDQMVYQTEKTLSEVGDKLDAADKGERRSSSRTS